MTIKQVLILIVLFILFLTFATLVAKSDYMMTTSEVHKHVYNWNEEEEEI